MVLPLIDIIRNNIFTSTCRRTDKTGTTNLLPPFLADLLPLEMPLLVLEVYQLSVVLFEKYVN